MDSHAARLFTPGNPAGRTAANSGRDGGWAASLTRTLWAVLALLVMGFVALSIPAGLAYYGEVCTETACGPRLTPEGVRALDQLGWSMQSYAAYLVGLDILLALTCASVGTVLVWRRPTEPVALLCAIMLLTFGGVTFSASSLALAGQPAWQWPASVAAYLGAVSLMAFLYLFPDGRFVPGWTRWALGAWALIEVPFHLLALVMRGTLLDSEASALYKWLLVAFIGSGIAALIYRYHRVATSVQRLQTKWVVLGTSMALMGFLGLVVLGAALGPSAREQLPGSLFAQSAFRVLMLFIPLSIAAAVLRYRLWDVDPLIKRTLVYGMLTVSVGGLYVAVVSYLGLVFRTDGNQVISLTATGLVAVLFQPLRERLQQLVNRLLYGDRSDPYAALSRLGRRLEATLTAETVLPTVVQTVAEALRIPSAVLVLADGGAETVVTYGPPVSGMLVLPLAYQGEMVGELRLAPRATDEPFSPVDRRLLDDLARQAGVAVHAVRLTADLQRSRERLVNTREEERRRLRRDLHDGLGPRLASLGLQLAALRNSLADTPALQAKLAELKEQTQEAVEDIRRLVDGLRPPALDEIGLAAAIAEQALRYSEHPSGLRLTVDVAHDLPPLSAAVEVAAYRIASEALTNVARHAHAAVCTICLSVVQHHGRAVLEVEVVDDGAGISTEARPGTGLLSMRERAEELGGSCVVVPVAPSGTRILARLPFVAED